MAFNKESIPNKIYQEQSWYILEINLPRGLCVKSKISLDSLEYVKSKHWTISGPSNNFYIVNKTNKKVIRLHRELLNVTSSSIFVDHINGDRLDNRLQNLRVCTKSQNNMNRRKTPTKLLKGIQKVIGRSGNISYTCRIKKNGIQLYLGTYQSLRDAVVHYNTKCKELHGEFAVLHEVPSA